MPNEPKTPVPKTDKSVAERFIDQLYSISPQFTNEKGEAIDIPDSGFLGLLATGYKGTAMLRKKRGQTHLYSKFTKGRTLAKKPHRPRK